MNENYIVINGKKAELTEEQLKALGIEVGKNPFARVGKRERYMFIDADNIVTSVTGDDIGFGNKFYSSVNYFNNRAFAEQVALHQLLYRKLLKFAYDNNCIDTAKWRRYSQHWFIYYDWDTKEIRPDLAIVAQQFSTIYFSTMKAAQRAINEVVKPFMKAHPEFVW